MSAQTPYIVPEASKSAKRLRQFERLGTHLILIVLVGWFVLSLFPFTLIAGACMVSSRLSQEGL